jgi:RHS repeat-associated protein
VQLVYNAFGQLVADYQEHEGAVNTAVTPSVGYTYADGSAGTIRRTGVVYPDGRTIGYQYSSGADDAFDRVTAILDGESASAAPIAQYARLGLNQFVQADYPQPSLRYDLAFGTGVDPYAGIDQFGRIVDLRWRNPSTGQDVERVQHGYDMAGNRLWRQGPVAAAMGVSADELYSYDGMSQLVSFARGQLTSDQTAIAAGSEAFAQAWSLDPTGNWSEFQQDSDGSGTWDLDQPRRHNAVNEITAFGASAGPQWAAPAYDLAGNMTGLPQPTSPGDGFACTYDAWNRLVGVVDATSGQTVAQYQYDGRGYRTLAQTYASGVLSEARDFYYSDQWQVLEERLGQTAVDRQFVSGLRYVDDLVLRDRDATGDGALDERLYGLQDPNWNVTALSDTTGAPVERYRYSAYGEPTFLSEAFASLASSSYDAETLYCGYRWDAGTGGCHVRYRALLCHVGRWERRDPIGFVAGDQNLYRYLGDSPAAAADPAGLVAPRAYPARKCCPAAIKSDNEGYQDCLQSVQDVYYDPTGGVYAILAAEEAEALQFWSDQQASLASACVSMLPVSDRVGPGQENCNFVAYLATRAFMLNVRFGYWSAINIAGASEKLAVQACDRQYPCHS